MPGKLNFTNIWKTKIKNIWKIENCVKKKWKVMEKKALISNYGTGYYDTFITYSCSIPGFFFQDYSTYTAHRNAGRVAQICPNNLLRSHTSGELLRDTIVIRTHHEDQNLYITVFFLSKFGPDYPVPPSPYCSRKHGTPKSVASISLLDAATLVVLLKSWWWRRWRGRIDGWTA